MSEDGGLAGELPWLEGVPPVVACNDGWHILIRMLHNRLLGIDPDYRVTQVKEKFGGLRYYVLFSEGLDDMLRGRAWEFISEAEEESLHICEICGQSGQLNEGPWYRTRCDLHDGVRNQYAALEATAGDDTEDQETVLGELREARHTVAERRHALDKDER